MNIKIKNIVGLFSVNILTISVLIMFFIPFTNVNHNTENSKQYCKYRFAVYEFSFIESEGESERKSDIAFFQIHLGTKVGGILEYFGLKKIDKGSCQQLSFSQEQKSQIINF
jgi:hypothetical protein